MGDGEWFGLVADEFEGAEAARGSSSLAAGVSSQVTGSGEGGNGLMVPGSVAGSRGCAGG